MAGSRLAVYLVMWLAGRQDGITLDEAILLWDGGYYLGNARDGWPVTAFQGEDFVGPGLAFFPLLSLLVRAVRAGTPLGVIESGMAVVIAGALLSGVLLWRLARDHLGDDEAADRTVALFAFLPGSVALALVYSEAVLLPAAIGCLLLLERRRWLWAGGVGALATLARPNGIVIVACCAWAAFAAVRRDRDWRSLAAPLLSPLGAVAYHAWVWRATGDATTWWLVQRDGWGDRVNPLAMVDRVSYLASHPTEDLAGWAVVGGLVVAVAGIVLLVRDKAPATWIVWAAGTTLLASTSTLLGMRPRFVLTAFPVLVPFAARLRGTAFTTVVGVSAMLLAVYAAMIVTTRFFVP